MRLDLSLDIQDRKLSQAIRHLERAAPAEIEQVTKTLAALGREWARDIITVVIYATPPRGGYQRTRYLLRSIYGYASKDQGVYAATIGAAADYTAPNELGTLDAAVEWEDILEDARRSRSELITLDYGDPEAGLEPRPFIIPALVMMERELPGLVLRAFRRLTPSGV